MRVITGRYKGRRLITVKDMSVRPATDRVKQVIFDILATRIDIINADVLDLFAGTGALGIEALSRGASRVDFVETGDDAARCIERNLIMLHAQDLTRVYRIDALRFVQDYNAGYNLIFADPPYGYRGTVELASLVFQREMMRPGGYLVMEHDADIEFQNTDLYAAGPIRKFGRTRVTFFSHPNTNRS
jgi:16S rRNA (guanine(966)-N(2))-methyltransferase RsmD